MREKKKGGRGRVEELRNKAVVILRTVDPKTFSYYKLGDIFSLDHSRVMRIMAKYKHLLPEGTYPQSGS